MDTMTVKVFDRSTWGTSAPYPLVRTITISKTCPKCGARRGEPKIKGQFDNGDMHYIHTWHNPCGHIDMYSEVLKEASKKKQLSTKETIKE